MGWIKDEGITEIYGNSDDSRALAEEAVAMAQDAPSRRVLAQAAFDRGAHFLFNSGEADRAGELFRYAIRVDASCANAHFGLGSYHLAKGAVDQNGTPTGEALDEFETALKFDEGHARARAVLGL